MKINPNIKADCIILMIDLTTDEVNTIDYAISLAKATNCSIRIVHALEFSSILGTETNAVSVNSEADQLKVAAVKQLKAIGESIARAAVPCDWELGTGNVHFWLPEYLDLVRPRLVIMATEGAGSSKTRGANSLVYKMINQADTPVLVVPWKATYQAFDHLVFATNYQMMDIVHLKFLYEVARYHQSKITVLHVSRQGLADAAQRKLLDKFRNEVNRTFSYPKLNFKLLFGENVKNRLNIFMNEFKVDVLAISTRKRTYINRLLKAGLTQEIINHNGLRTPVLAFHHPTGAFIQREILKGTRLVGSA